jgi:hypothetical protein
MSRMARLYVILGFVTVAVYIYALVDAISIHEWRIKSLNKAAWVLIILVLPLVGAILWFTIGKLGAHDARGEGGGARRTPPRVLAPDDDPAFLRKASRFEEQEARIRELEAELKALDDDDPKQ